jgi:hypothetical protein
VGITGAARWGVAGIEAGVTEPTRREARGGNGKDRGGIEDSRLDRRVLAEGFEPVLGTPAMAHLTSACGASRIGASVPRPPAEARAS